MKTIIILLISFFSLTLYSQSIEIFGGPNKNIFHDYSDGEGHFMSSYNPALGYNIGIGIDDIKIDWLKLRFTLCFDNYGGELEASDGGLGGGYTTNAEIDKSVLSLGLFPLNLKIIKRLDLNFGFEFSMLINETYTGTKSGWLMGEPGWSYNIEDEYDRYSALTNFGLKARIAYDINLAKSIIISPQYSFYYGLSNEFDEFPEQTVSMRHYIGIGIEKKLF
jgi:hypothetical protein